ncbi:glycosyltransferase family 4 protein [Flavobacterium sp. H4147]|uniref:glycosyltransferase family 4 protein n=1 Tax=Flavobacterium sp. H4147 TaxID=3034149 RepID=UPI0023ED9CED|nr:glycosyltransferase family 4 protein [Flavobacterium sp. H4147]
MKKAVKKIVYSLLAVWNLLKFLIFDLKKIKNAEVVCFFPFYKTGGAEKVHLNIVKAISSKNVCVIFTVHSATTNFYKEFTENAECIEINPILNKKNDLVNKWLMKSIYKNINQSANCKTVFGCNSIYFYKIISKISEKISRNDLFHSFSENDERETDLIYSAKYIDNRIVINDAAKNDIINFYIKNKIDAIYADKIKVIHNGIELPNSEFKTKDNPNIRIGFIGRWSAEKRPEVFLEIARQIKSKYSFISFVMAGTGMKSNLDLITNAGVEFLGEITNKEQLDELYAALNFIITPSVYEGFPMVIMEGMSHGVIPVSTNLEGIREHITSAFNGILIHETDENKMVVAFCESIEKLIDNSEERNLLSKQCFEYAQKHFGIEKFNTSYQKILLS